MRRFAEREPARANVEAGILCASGFVAGEGLAGVLIAGWTFLRGLGRYEGPPATPAERWMALLALLGAGRPAVPLGQAPKSA